MGRLLAAHRFRLQHRDGVRQLVLRCVVRLALWRLLHMRFKEIFVEALARVLVREALQVNESCLAVGAAASGRRLLCTFEGRSCLRPSLTEFAGEECHEAVQLHSQTQCAW